MASFTKLELTSSLDMTLLCPMFMTSHCARGGTMWVVFTICVYVLCTSWNSPWQEGKTIAQIAAEMGHNDLFQYFLSIGVDEHLLDKKVA